jgi:hypothetical protein
MQAADAARSAGVAELAALREEHAALREAHAGEAQRAAALLSDLDGVRAGQRAEADARARMMADVVAAMQARPRSLPR